tara:strand:- start:4043 stop:5743 length:1701 start_codon:yes stop_codon:yes gene_type:complete
MNFSINYKKNKNEILFKTLENSILGLKNMQNYIPIYKHFFSLNSGNYNKINLNQHYSIESIDSILSKNIMQVELRDISNQSCRKQTFCKFSPLLNPLRYITGKYELDKEQLFTLPTLEENSIAKLNDYNNTSYIDGFFTYLSSQLLHTYNIVNCIDYYGSFLCNQDNFLFNMIDDIEYLNDNDWFHKNNQVLFEIEEDEYNNIFNLDSRNNKKKICINEKIDSVEYEFIEKHVTDLSFGIVDLSNSIIYNSGIVKSSSLSSSSSCSSQSSNTSNESDDSDNDENGENDTESEDEENSDSTSTQSYGDEESFLKIKDFPIELICLEKCEKTLDYLLEENLLDEEGWKSCLFQVIISLCLYQKVFSFTHNDLHTNNIMYIETEKQFLYYCFESKYYKVPTYGKIFKIIDFGRSIYKYKGKQLCSDAFHSKGDAATQYNFEPFFNEDKPRLEPNFSFDLCRLACCLYDHFIEDLEEAETIIKNNKIARLVNKWLIDDKERNILYKNNGEERYPEFKLYKMIARTIHNAIPSEEINNELFASFIISKKKINKKSIIMNIDKIQSYTTENN